MRSVVNEKCGRKCWMKNAEIAKRRKRGIALSVLSVLQALIYYQYFSLSTTLRIFYRSTFFTDPKFRHSSFSALCIPPCPPYPMQFENHLDDAIKTLLKLLVLK